MTERLVFALALIVIGVAVWVAHNRLALKRLAKKTPTDPALTDAAPGTPVILYFTTPFCAPCKTQQQPALQKLAARFGRAVQIIQVDATEDAAAADRWGVFSAPTTFVLDAAHTPRFVNRGVATDTQLAQQLADLGATA